MKSKCVFCLLLIAASLAAVEKQTGTAHFYRYKQFEGSALKPSVYCDGIELARIENGRYFQIEIPSGEHTFYANDKQAGAVVKVEAGKDYYFRVDLQTGFWKGHYRLNVVAPEQGEYDLRKLKPLDSNKVVHASVPDTAAAN